MTPDTTATSGTGGPSTVTAPPAPILDTGEVNDRLDHVAHAVDRILGPEQDPADPARESLHTSRVTPHTPAWLGERSPVTHLEAYDFDVWVHWLIDTYPIRAKMPRDWLGIPAVAAELWALWRLHSLAVEDNATERDLLDWHRALADSLSRIELWTREARKTRQLQQLADQP
jgi:hypothetical protein